MQGRVGNGGREVRGPHIRRTDDRGQLKPGCAEYTGLQIRTGRRLAALSRQTMAEDIGVDLRMLAAYEHGDSEPSSIVMNRIAAVLTKPLSWFSYPTETPTRLSGILSQWGEVTAIRTSHGAVDKRVAGLDHRPCVLLVDDAPDVLIILGAFMESAGLQVIRANSGDEALRIVASDKPLHAIVADNIMPGLSGSDLLLQAAQIRPGLPGLIVTGCAADVNGLSELPKTVTVLIKPFRREDLVRRIREVTQANDRLSLASAVPVNLKD